MVDDIEFLLLAFLLRTTSFPSPSLYLLEIYVWLSCLKAPFLSNKIWVQNKFNVVVSVYFGSSCVIIHTYRLTEEV